VFQLGCTFGGKRWELCALFQYGQDEQTLTIIGIGFSALPPDAESEKDFPEIQ
jgi:hypothetical protein